MDNKKKRIILGSVGLVFVVAIVVLAVILNKDDGKEPIVIDYDQIDSVVPTEVQNIYNIINIDNCKSALIWTVNNDEKLTIKDMNSDSINNMVFKKLSLDNKLNDEFDYDEYKKVLSDVFGLENNYKIDFQNFNYNGYKYNIVNGKITREKSNCTNEINYISNLYGYSYNNDGLLVYVNVGILNNNKVYDLDNKELGTYTDSEEELKKLLNKSKGYLYTYRKTGDNYYLESVELVKKVFK